MINLCGNDIKLFKDMNILSLKIDNPNFSKQVYSNSLVNKKLFSIKILFFL